MGGLSHGLGDTHIGSVSCVLWDALLGWEDVLPKDRIKQNIKGDQWHKTLETQRTCSLIVSIGRSLCTTH